MKTLKDFAEILYSKGYKESSVGAYEFLDGSLQSVDFVKNEFLVSLHTCETEEYEKYLRSLPDGTEYEADYNGYIVVGAFIESPICNIADFYDGDSSGITLVAETTEYHQHSLDLFEKCLELQTPNLIEHELFIMKKRIEHLNWAKNELIPVLNKADYIIEYDSFFKCNVNSDSSNMVISFKHPNTLNGSIDVYTDCITGDIIISVPGNGNVSNLLYNKNSEEIYSFLLENVWKKYEMEYGYLYVGDPKETIDSCNELRALFANLRYKDKDKVNVDLIPERYMGIYERWAKEVKEKNDEKN